MAQYPGELSLGKQEHPQCHDFCILLSWCWFCGTFQGYLAEPSEVTVCGLGHVHVAVIVPLIGGITHLSGNDCAEHCWDGHFLCIMRGFMKWCQ